MDETMEFTRYDMKKIPIHLRPVVQELIIGTGVFQPGYDTEDALTDLAGTIVKVVRAHDIQDTWKPKTIDHLLRPEHDGHDSSS